MKIRIGKYTWNSKKCVPLQILKYGLIATAMYFMYIACYYILMPLSTLG